MSGATNSLVQGYRKYLEQSGKVDLRSDIELTVELGNILRTQGNDVFDAKASEYPDFREQYLTATQSTDRGVIGEVAAGARRGARSLAGTAMGAVALGLDAVGADETAKSLATKAEEFASGGEDNAATVGRMKDVIDVEGGARYAAGKIGEAIPSIAEALVTATIGATAGTAAAPGPGTAGGAAAGFIGKQAVKQMIRKGVATRILGKEVTEAALETALKDAANDTLRTAFVNESRALAARMGAGAVGAINSLGLSSGEIYNETGDVATSLGAGAIAAIPDTILPTYIIGKFFPGGAASGLSKTLTDPRTGATITVEKGAAAANGFMKRLATEAAKTMPIEAGTEAFQELVNIAAVKFNKGEPATLDAADLERIKEAAVGGLAGGVVAAPLAAAPAPNAAIEARRRAATGTPLPPPATTAATVPPPPKAPTRGEVVAKWVAAPPDSQDARINALLRVTRTKDEDQELEVLQALASQRPPAVAATGTPPPPRGPPPPPRPGGRSGGQPF